MQGIIYEHDCKVLYNYFLLLWCYHASLCRDLFNKKYNWELCRWFSLRQWLAIGEPITSFLSISSKFTENQFYECENEPYIIFSFIMVCYELAVQTVLNKRQWRVKLFGHTFVNKLIRKHLFYDSDEIMIDPLRKCLALLTRWHCPSFFSGHDYVSHNTFTCFVEIIWPLTRIAP